MGATAGGIGAFLGTPADVAMVRMCVDNRLPKDQRRNYTSVLDAWRRIIGRFQQVLIIEKQLLLKLYR